MHRGYLLQSIRRLFKIFFKQVTDMMRPHTDLPSMSWMLFSCLMLLSQVQGEDSPKEVPTPRTRCPKGSKAYASHCYALFMTPKSWMNADMACQKRPSGHLVSVLSGAEASFVASLVQNSANTYSNIWMGLHDPTEGYEPNAGGWEWSSTDVLNYLAWERHPSTNPNPGYCGSLSASTVNHSDEESCHVVSCLHGDKLGTYMARN
ncbi:lithostathine-like isoform X1 [Panthera leo]|uniref:lithostathine-like isoform X1 n=2 Tax=Panthera leo TaxID=9689 RepID=UPI001C694381|nr:lithostathine-like isoform X1 [Panthera leo]XP_042786177.1 lithostathine-like isoform X1 [Panthera leo]XP_042786178.1 lithostathine-like isoform X1 [Panthera leo]